MTFATTCPPNDLRYDLTYDSRGAQTAERPPMGHASGMPADPTVEVFGVYPVDGVESCYLVELMITGSDSPPAFAEFTQPMPGSPRSDWQVPYDEKLLDDDGAGVLVDLFFEAPESWPSRARVAFYFHELFAEEPMSTPFGETALPQPSPMPERLSFLAYEAP